MKSELKETLSLGSSPEGIWADYEPNKPRLMLTPSIDTEVALAAFFNAVETQNMRELRRIYRPCIPLNTFGSPDLIYPESVERPYELMGYAAEDFQQMTAGRTVRLSGARFGIQHFDNVKMLAALFRSTPNFEQTREELTDDAVASMRLQDSSVGDIPVDKEHLPDIVMPLARTYRDNQLEKVGRNLLDIFSTFFPDELTLTPYLAPPTIQAVRASYPECPSRIQERLKRHKARQAHRRNGLCEEELDTHGVDGAVWNAEMTLLDRMLQHAHAYPGHHVAYHGHGAEVESSKDIPPNLILANGADANYAHIRM